MQRGAAAQFEQKGKGVLRHGLGPVVDHVHDRNAPLARLRHVNHVVARGHDPDAAQIGQGRQRLGIQAGLVGNEDFRAPAALQNGFGRRAVVDGHVAKGLQRGPRIVAGIQGIAVKDHNFHVAAPC